MVTGRLKTPWWKHKKMWLKISPFILPLVVGIGLYHMRIWPFATLVSIVVLLGGIIWSVLGKEERWFWSMLLVCGVILFLISLGYQAQIPAWEAFKLEQKTIPLQHNTFELKITYPRQIPLEAREHAGLPLAVYLVRPMTISAVTSSPTITIPVLYTVTFRVGKDAGILFANGEGKPAPPRLRITSGQMADNPAALYLHQIATDAISRTRVVAVSYTVWGKKGRETKGSFDIALEDGYGAWWRHFWGLVLGPSTPLLSLAAVLVSFGWQKWREAEKRKREEAERVFQGIREKLRESNPKEAKVGLNKLKKKDLEPYIPQTDIEYIENLIKIALENELDLDLEEIIYRPRWPEEVGGSLLVRVGKLTVGERRKLHNVVERFLQNEELSSELKEKLQREVDRWRRVEKEVLPVPKGYPARIRPKPSPSSDIGGLKYSPFKCLYAEDDLNFLFCEEGGFWSKHPSYQDLCENWFPEVVYGREGSGKTALAYALGEIIPEKGVQCRFLPLYITGSPDILEIQEQVTRALLQYIRVYPFKLSYLSYTQRSILAQQQCASLGYEASRSFLEEVTTREPPSWVETEGQKKFWEEECLLQLNSFARLLEEYRYTSWSGAREWLEWTNLSRSVLELDYLLISLDLDMDDAIYIRQILNLLRPWSRFRLVIKLFIPQALALDIQPASFVEFRSLTWTDEQLKKMTEWRFETAARLSNVKLTIEQVFDPPGLYPQFIRHAQRNPRRLVQLWRYMVEQHFRNNSERQTFSADDLEWAVEHLK